MDGATPNPPVTQPRLVELVGLARGQRAPSLRVDSEAIVRGVAQRRATRGRTFFVGTMLAAAAVWLLWTRIVPGLTQGHEVAPGEQAPNVFDGAHGSGDAVPRSETPMPSVRPASSVVEDVAADPIVEEALPVPAEPVPPASTPATPAAGPSPSELAREAERAMTQRRRKDAIALLDTLVRKYPNHAAAKAALLDLGRLLREEGRRDDARCAYRMLVRRWPGNPARVEVEQMLTALGEGPECRGLRPVRTP